MKNVYLICYDIGDPKRWRQVYKTMLGVGDPLQYSVFRCELSLVEQQLLKERLWPILNFDHDRMMIVNLGPAGARGDDCVEFWGDPCVEPPQRGPIIV